MDGVGRVEKLVAGREKNEFFNLIIRGGGTPAKLAERADIRKTVNSNLWGRLIAYYMPIY